MLSVLLLCLAWLCCAALLWLICCFDFILIGFAWFAVLISHHILIWSLIIYSSILPFSYVIYSNFYFDFLDHLGVFYLPLMFVSFAGWWIQNSLIVVTSSQLRVTFMELCVLLSYKLHNVYQMFEPICFALHYIDS